jgi:hypothetical protein
MTFPVRLLIGVAVLCFVIGAIAWLFSPPWR